jgi:hypothetical protein
MPESIIDISRDFFEQIVLPVLLEHYPEETGQTAFGVFGYGSEALRMDDEFSRDHHWGIRIDALMPKAIFQHRRDDMLHVLAKNLPPSFKGHDLRAEAMGHSAGSGLAPDSYEDFLTRTIGIDHPPRTYEEWLKLPEPDIMHLINGEVWHDPNGRFSTIREQLGDYYPEPVRLRRIAHWSRYYSGMGAYALKRAILRNNDFYATIVFSRAIYLGTQLAFMLDHQYYPYDKWLMDFFSRLPRMYERMGALVEESVLLTTPWQTKLDLLDQISDVLDATMVEDGILKPHPKYVGSDTSGYRLMERAYQEIIQGLPQEIKTIVPVWDQIYLEAFHSGFVDSIDSETWLAALNLTPVE